MKTDKIKEMFSRQGFGLARSKESVSLANSPLTFSTPGLSVLVVDDRGIQYIEVASPNDERSYDMTLVMTLVSGKDFLLEEPDLEDEFQFVVQNLDKLKELFGKRNYEKTKISLGELELARAKRMFPGWY
jgi:hypothetical protein